MMRASIGVASPTGLVGYPLPSQFSWCSSTAARIGGESFDALEDAAADDGMFLHLGKLFVGQAAGFLEHGVGDADLSDVVQQGADADAFDFSGVQTHGHRGGGGELADARLWPAV